MSSSYYCLIAGLRDYSIADKGQKIDFEALRAEIFEALSVEDRASAQLLYTYFDLLNLVNVHGGKNVPFNHLGILTKAQIEAEIEAAGSDDDPFETRLPASIRLVLDKHSAKVELDEDEEKIENLESRLFADYYALAAKSKCRFVRLWSHADSTIRNIVATKAGGEAVGEIGDDAEFAYSSELQSIIETRDLLEREHKMDALRWEIADELSEHNYFDIDAVMSYMVRVNILYRWSSLDKAVGEERFRALVAELTAKSTL